MSLTSSDSHGVVSSVFLGGIMPFLCRIWDSLVCGHIDMALSKISACHQDKCLFPTQRDANSFWQSLGGCMSGIDLQALNPGSNPWDKDTLWKTTSHMDQKTNGNSPLLCGNTTALLIFTGFASLVRLCLGLGLLWGLIPTRIRNEPVPGKPASSHLSLLLILPSRYSRQETPLPWHTALDS